MNRRTFAPERSIVTGGASGIGFSIARSLVERGGHVAIADLDADAAGAAAASLGPRASAHALDVADAADVQALVDGVVAEHGRLDCMVNNAGILLNGPVDEYDAGHWRRAVDVNLLGVVHGSRAAYDVMVRQGHGTILNTGSLAGLMVAPRQLPYTVTKHAVVAFSRGLALEAGRRGVGVHVLCPAFVDTKLLDEPLAPGGARGQLPAPCTLAPAAPADAGRGGRRRAGGGRARAHRDPGRLARPGVVAPGARGARRRRLGLGAHRRRHRPADGEGPVTPRGVLVIGAGPAGLAAAGALVRRGIRPVVLERSDDVGATWRRHYDRLPCTPRASCRGWAGYRSRAGTAGGSPATTWLPTWSSTPPTTTSTSTPAST